MARGCRWWWIARGVRWPWREMIVEAGLEPEIARTDENTPLVRTAVDTQAARDRRSVDARSGQDSAAAMATRTARAAGLDAGGGYARIGPISVGPRPARSRHPFAACLGPDAGRDSTNSHWNQGCPSGTADQRSSAAIAPGRERGGTSGRRGGVLALAPGLRLSGRRVSLRRLARGAKLSVANGDG